MATRKLKIINPTVVNAQKPFSFSEEEKVIRVKRPINYTRSELPVNIKALCVGCARWYQKTPKSIIPPNNFHVCPKCGDLVVTLPIELLPWRLLAPETPWTKKTVPFTCPKCKRHYCSWAMFGVVCGHKAHGPVTTAVFFCRLCCRKVAPVKEKVEPPRQEQVHQVSDPFDDMLPPPRQVREAAGRVNFWYRGNANPQPPNADRLVFHNDGLVEFFLDDIPQEQLLGGPQGDPAIAPVIPAGVVIEDFLYAIPPPEFPLEEEEIDDPF